MESSETVNSIKERTVLFDSMQRLDHLARDNDIDSYVDDMFDKVNAVEYVINGAESTLEERSEYRQELDGQWKYLQQTAIVSGWAYIKKGNLTPDIPEYEKVLIENDQEVTSTGFTILSMPVINGDEVIPSYKVGFSFTKKGKSFSMLRHECNATFGVSPVAMAEKRLLYYHADEVMNVVGRLNNYDQTHDSSAILALKDYSIEFLTHSLYTDEYKKDMELYLCDVLQFDPELPYLISYTSDDQQPERKFVVAQPTYVSLEPQDNADTTSPRTHVPYLYASMYSADPKEPNVPLTIPFSRLEQFSPVRNLAG